MKAIKLWGWWALAALACASAHAAELTLEGSYLRLTGPLTGEHAQAFADELASGRIRTVVFEDSTGGVPEVAERYAQAIRAADINTEARGLCHAACAYAFLAGKARRFGRGAQFNSLLIPMRSRAPTAALEQTLVEFRTPPDATAAAAPQEPWPPEQGLLFTSTATLFGRVYKSYWCDGTQKGDPSRCEQLEDADPRKLGVLTP
jgi:hypothetical protein